MAVARMPPRGGRELDMGFFLALRLAGRGWRTAAGGRELCPNQSQCNPIALRRRGGRRVQFRDLMGPADYERDVSDLASRGLYLTCLPGVPRVRGDHKMTRSGVILTIPPSPPYQRGVGDLGHGVGVRKGENDMS